MKQIGIVYLILAAVGCGVFRGYYPFNELTTIKAYQKEGKELFLEVWTGDSARWIDDAVVVEKENRVVIRVTYTMSDPSSDFIRNKEGNFVKRILASTDLGNKEVLYQDDSGLHKIEIKEWRSELMEPYVVPELFDPFATPRAEPVDGGQ